MRKLRAVTVVTALAVSGLLITGCGASSSSQSTATKAAYDYPASFGPSGECYYVYSPTEISGLIQAGYCAPGSMPVQAPVSWQETYWAYLDSAAYYDVYVPTRYRTVYVRTEKTFGSTYHTAILSHARTATYKSTAGAIVHGYNAGTVKFGSGTSFGSGGQKYGGGNLRAPKPVNLPKPVILPKPVNIPRPAPIRVAPVHVGH